MLLTGSAACRWFKNLLIGVWAGIQPVDPTTQKLIDTASIAEEENLLERSWGKSQGDYSVGRFDYRYLHARYQGPRADVREQSAMTVIPERERLKNRSFWKPDVEAFIKARLHHDENVV